MNITLYSVKDKRACGKAFHIDTPDVTVTFTCIRVKDHDSIHISGDIGRYEIICYDGDEKR